MLTGKKVLVIGLARSGKAAVKLLQKLNATIEGQRTGKPEMVQGTVKGEAGKIREWIQKIAEELSYEK